MVADSERPCHRAAGPFGCNLAVVLAGSRVFVSKFVVRSSSDVLRSWLTLPVDRHRPDRAWPLYLRQKTAAHAAVDRWHPAHGLSVLHAGHHVDADCWRSDRWRDVVGRASGLVIPTPSFRRPTRRAAHRIR